MNKNNLLPSELPFQEAVRVYRHRLMVFLSVILINICLFLLVLAIRRITELDLTFLLFVATLIQGLYFLQEITQDSSETRVEPTPATTALGSSSLFPRKLVLTLIMLSALAFIFVVNPNISYYHEQQSIRSSEQQRTVVANAPPPKGVIPTVLPTPNTSPLYTYTFQEWKLLAQSGSEVIPLGIVALYDSPSFEGKVITIYFPDSNSSRFLLDDVVEINGVTWLKVFVRGPFLGWGWFPTRDQAGNITKITPKRVTPR